MVNEQVGFVFALSGTIAVKGTVLSPTFEPLLYVLQIIVPEPLVALGI